MFRGFHVSVFSFISASHFLFSIREEGGGNHLKSTSAQADEMMDTRLSLVDILVWMVKGALRYSAERDCWQRIQSTNLVPLIVEKI